LLVGSSNCGGQGGKVGAAALLQRVQLGQCRIQVTALVLQHVPAPLDVGDQELQLAALAGLLVVEAQDVGDLAQSEAEPLAAQDELEPDPLTIREDPGGADPFRRQQALVLIEPDGA
jgi:hypothetical protein